MSLIQMIQCDGRTCQNIIDIVTGDTVRYTLRLNQWTADEDAHYCPKCWAKIEKEQASK